MRPFLGVSRRITTIRLLAQRFTLAVLIAGCLVLMLLARTNNGGIARGRIALADAISPILDLLSRPTATVAGAMATLHDLANIRAENQRLIEQNRDLLHWQTLAGQLARENLALRSQLNSVPDPDAAFATARVIGDTGGAFVRSVLIDAGAADGLRPGQAVIASEALIGRITDVGRHSARVLLLTDINSHIPVMLANNGAKAVLSGDNSDQPHLDFLASRVGATQGQPIVTSGDGGVFPPGLPIGRIASGAGGAPRVALYIQRAELNYVTVVDYGLPGLISDDGDTPDDGDDRP